MFSVQAVVSLKVSLSPVVKILRQYLHLSAE